MKKYFAHLRPMERRLAVGVLVVVIIVLNAWLIWPHFSDWGKLRGRLDDARRKQQLYQTTIAQKTNFQAQLKAFESLGESSVAPEDQTINFMRVVQAQAAESGVGIGNNSRQMTKTNEFFVEQSQNISVTATDEQLVNFLYKLGSGASMIRVRDLELQPDGAHTRLNANIQLVASYQKNPALPARTAAPAGSKPITKTAR